MDAQHAFSPQHYFSQDLLHHACSGSLPAAHCAQPSQQHEAFAPHAVPGSDAPAATCSNLSDGQLLALTDTASLTADQLDRRHHLLRHSLPDAARGESALVHFEAGSVHEAVKLIKKMSQRDLQAKFKLVYGAKTFSNNNNWLRRKLFEAIGVDPAKGAVKKATSGGAGGKRRRAAPARSAAAQRAPRATRTVAPRAARTTPTDWFAPGAYSDGQQAAAVQSMYGYDDNDMQGSEDEGQDVCEALLALGEAAASLEDSYSEGSVPSVTMSAEASPAGEAALASTAAAASEEGEAACAATAGAAAFRRLLLEQHEQLLAAEAAQQQQAALAAAAAAPGPADWMAMLQQHAAAAAAASAAAGGNVMEQHAAAQMQAAAAVASMHPMMAASLGLLPPPPVQILGGWPGAAAAAAYGAHPMMPPLFHQPMQHGVLNALRYLVARQQQGMHAPAVAPTLAAAI